MNHALQSLPCLTIILLDFQGNKLAVSFTGGYMVQAPQLPSTFSDRPGHAATQGGEALATELNWDCWNGESKRRERWTETFSENYSLVRFIEHLGIKICCRNSFLFLFFSERIAHHGNKLRFPWLRSHRCCELRTIHHSFALPDFVATFNLLIFPLSIHVTGIFYFLHLPLKTTKCRYKYTIRGCYEFVKK